MAKFIVTIFHLEHGDKTYIKDVFRYNKYDDAFGGFTSLQKEGCDLWLSRDDKGDGNPIYIYNAKKGVVIRNTTLSEEEFKMLTE